MVFTAKAQWIKDSTSALPRYLKSTYMINEDIRFVVSDQYIYKTTNAGKTWVKSTLFAKGDFVNIGYQKIDFIKNRIGFIQSQMSGISNLYTSKDTGKTWTAIPLKTKIKDCKILFISESIWLAFNDKYIEKTSDSGQTWQSLNTNNSDTVIYHVEVMKNNEIMVLTCNNDSLVNVNLSLDFGSQWEKIAELNDLYYSQEFLFCRSMIADIIKYSSNYLMHVTWRCVGCGSYYDRSTFYKIVKETGKWKTTKKDFKFDYPPGKIYNLNDTLHIATYSTIYKSDNFSDNWYTVYRIDHYINGYFLEFNLINNNLYISTSSGNFYKKANPNSSKNLSSITNNPLHQSLVFPNPANDYLTFRFKDKNNRMMTLIIYDKIGKQLFWKEYNNPDEIILNTDFLPSGNYSYTLLKGKGIEKSKFSIVK